ncbi:hypothetical protein HMN09_00144500 [Mycena chlorophos]|uniref:Uncharacterized protein n=1 Tax=Mycena chlorophos TaxID=658473 RepID=A0A8H6TKF8_MYCCL|nr:hypothetical protein HMN09_00144500 [Mycena chlorophos]
MPHHSDSENSPTRSNAGKSRRKHASAPHRKSGPLRDHNPPSDDLAERVRQLEAEKAEIRAEADAAKAEAALLREQRATPSPSNTSASTDIIKRPQNLSNVTMKSLRTMLGYNKSRWNGLRTNTRFASNAARLDPELNWQAQDSKKVAKMVNVVQVDFPETRRFENGWGIKLIAQQSFSGGKSYRRCVDDPSTYRGRKTHERREAHGPTPSPSPSHSRSHSPSHSPSPGPSSVVPRRRSRGHDSRSDNDDSENEHNDDLLDFSDNEGPQKKKQHRT